MLRNLLRVFFIVGLTIVWGCGEKIGESAELFSFWHEIQNPVYSHEGWSTKDACMIERDGVFHVFFSAFYHDRERERSHVASVYTKDFLTFSEPLFLWDGSEDDWIGMCSPGINKVGDNYYLTYNSWGDKKEKPNQLFYAVSDDLVNWKKDIPLAQNLTAGNRAIDAAVAYTAGGYYLMYKEGKPGTVRLARAESMDGPWEFVGDGLPRLLMAADGMDNGRTHENYEFMNIDGQWMLLTTDYRPHEMHLYKMAGSGNEPKDWLEWVDGRVLLMPREAFNTDHNSNAGFIADWRDRDGYFYCIYAGRTEGETHSRRGDNKLGLARSRDLLHWEVP